ncbi:DUF262 domain-containing protein [Corynebacterium canis]|uniref:DUF262 domain-containing protein n=1 Tax=Corynebacterium canis TaxID=679663 RepID=A0A5C5UT09_9CORY|nr:DUF262 domain-containing protein [Corynebacterium canis]TWT28917.1 DUF262 domain-containing protein [Corynebacterium canis]WJY75062.1 hypothetical protein CCANI_06080 [Corynebacterium canis]
MSFSTPSYDLLDLFGRIDRGDLQLPDFQRDYSWDVDQIRSLLVTVLRGYPVGCFMALDTRNEPMRFRPRPLGGAPDRGVDPGLLLLDGQQRLTTLYQSLCGDGEVRTKDPRNKRIRRKFFVDVARAVSADIMPDEAVFSVDETGKVRSHFGPNIPDGIYDHASAIAAGVVPVSVLLFSEGTDMLFDLVDVPGGDRETVKRFYNRVMKPLSGYSVPVIRLDRETARGGVGSIFAKANSAGAQMDVFELLTAVFGTQDPNFKLSEHWAEIQQALRQHSVLDEIGPTEFLTAVALLVTHHRGQAHGQREDILDLDLDAYVPAAAAILAGFEAAAEFLYQRCVFSKDLVPYTSQIIPLAVILALLQESDGQHEQSLDRLNQWFWSGVFGELYGSPAVEVRAARDVDQVVAWVRDPNAPVPATVQKAVFMESRLLSAAPDSGLYRGIWALIMARGARDWRTGRLFDRQSFEELAVSFSRIFPQGWDVDPLLANSVLNHTPMSRRTEVILSDASPARYLGRVQNKSLMEDAEFDALIASHLLDPELLHQARATEFLTDRRQRLLAMVEEAMGAEAVRDVDESDLAGGEEGPDAFAKAH